MAATWTGHLKISLVTVPVQAFSAASPGGGRISLNQLHAECHSRIRYVKTCPIHGEVPNSEIVSGYEYAKGQYVVVDPDEIKALRTESERNVDVSAFVKADSVDPVYYSGKSYYLLPDGRNGEKPYTLIQQTMAERRVHAVGQAVFSRNEELVLIRPIEDFLVASVLLYDSQVKNPHSWEHEIPEVRASKQESQLTSQLVETMTTKKFEIADYHDVYTEKLRLLIDAKVEGREIVAPEAVKEPEVINLMDAIKKSLKQASPATGRKPLPRLSASRVRRQKAAARKTSDRKRKIS